MFSTNFIVYGKPIPKGRARFRRIGKFVSTYTPKKTATYEQEVAKIAKIAMGDQEPLETPVTVCIYIRMPIPASYSKARKQACLDGYEKPTKRPDLTNVTKSLEDGMNGIVYKDDSQIVNLHITKVYSETPAVEVLIVEALE